MHRTLIVYGTRKGTTETTAQVIGETLVLKYGQYVEMANIRRIRKFKKRLDDFDNLVVGTSIIGGRWVCRVLRFLRKNDLSGQKVALFITAGNTMNKELKYGLTRDQVREEAIRKYIDPHLIKFSYAPVSKMAFGGMVVRGGSEKYNSWSRDDIESWAVHLGKIFSENT